jgi:hypothetical protein
MEEVVAMEQPTCLAQNLGVSLSNKTHVAARHLQRPSNLLPMDLQLKVSTVIK